MRMDYHLHSRYSGDGQSAIEEICREALEKGLTHIALTDHHDIGNTNYELKDPSAYLADLARCRELFPGLDLAYGVEMDYRAHTWERMQRFPVEQGLDFALLSLHFVDGVDPYLPEYFEGRTQREGYAYYLKQLAEMIAVTDGPWVLGHITYVSKFARFPDTRLRYAEYPEELDEVLRLAVKKGYGLEINASGLKNGAGVLPGTDILTRYRELGGEILTLGSDAHCAADVGRWIGDATDAARAAGFRYLAVYREMKPKFLKID